MGGCDKQAKKESEIDCEQILVEYPVESYGEQKKKCGEEEGKEHQGCQSHHVIQNAHFVSDRRAKKADQIKICEGYDEKKAPCIPLEDGTDVNTQHGKVSQMQREASKSHRKKYNKGKGKSPTYADARKDAKDQLMEPDPGPGLTEDEAECILIKVDEMFKDMCGDDIIKKSDEFELRTPGIGKKKGYGLPSTFTGTGGSVK